MSWCVAVDDVDAATTAAPRKLGTPVGAALRSPSARASLTLTGDGARTARGRRRRPLPVRRARRGRPEPRPGRRGRRRGRSDGGRDRAPRPSTLRRGPSSRWHPDVHRRGRRPRTTSSGDWTRAGRSCSRVRARMRSMRWITSLLATQRALDVARRRRALPGPGRRRRCSATRWPGSTSRPTRPGPSPTGRSPSRAPAGPNPELAMLPLVTAEVEERVYLAGVEALGADGLDLGLDGPRAGPAGRGPRSGPRPWPTAPRPGAWGPSATGSPARVLGLRAALTGARRTTSPAVSRAVR